MRRGSRFESQVQAVHGSSQIHLRREGSGWGPPGLTFVQSLCAWLAMSPALASQLRLQQV